MSKRVCLSLAEKIKVLEEVDKGCKKIDVAAKFGVSPSCVSLIIKSRDSIIKKPSVPSSRKRVRVSTYEDVNEAVLRWFQVARTHQNVPISGNLIKQKALQFAKEFNCVNFQASEGWLSAWKTRNSIVFKTVSGESASVSQEDCDIWTETVLKSALKKYEPKNVFNCDETGLFFKCLPNKTFAFKSDKCFGVKTSKERVTLMVGANMDGSEKLKLLLIGKSKNPRCLKGVKSLELDYANNKKAWMTSEIFERWIKELDTKMKSQKRKIVMFIDNCPAHPVTVSKKLRNIELIFFPPNMTSKLQPMDQGIIKNIKHHYRNRIVHKIVNAIDNNLPVQKLITLKECITEVAKVWSENVSQKTIKNCFSKAGFTEKIDEWEEEDEMDLATLKRQWGILQKTATVDADFLLEDFLEIDNDVGTTDLPTDQDIIDDIKSIEDHEEETETGECPAKFSENEIRNAFDIVRTTLRGQESVPDQIFMHLNKCENFVEQQLFFKSNVQKKITDYFS